MDQAAASDKEVGSGTPDEPVIAAVVVEQAPAGEPGPPPAEAPDPGEPPGAATLQDLVITWRDALCVGPIMLSSLYVLLGGPITPALIFSHPVLAAFLRGSVPTIIYCGALSHGGGVPLWQALLAPLLVLSWVDPFLYWAGRRYGRALFEYYSGQSAKMRRRVERGEDWFARYGVFAILVSAFVPFGFIFYVAAGESRMNFWKFLAADLVSNLLGITVWVALGYTLGKDRGTAVSDSLSHYALWFTLASIALVVVIVGRQVRTQMRAQRESQDQ